ncbi:Peroxisomal biogenesis factor, putative [Pediculus humanus corporis]|uniref:Peroxin-19 n=1 Tax=Pediculus humanus subsp. corporis TaxID=121224 RepID=E0W135_PEDHC|nr:Peroxisomal biogenesis factor, putative [Pediculus humanus corporis]EEB19341.1 Peroxisomal biogenesis factor, putative [Pediculus humanus corporis]
MTDKIEKPDLDGREENSQGKEDEELSALLDSALEDFNKSDKPANTNDSVEVTKPESKRPDPPLSLWNEEFLQQTSARFEQNIQALFSPGSDGMFSVEQLGENIQRLAEAATQTAGFDASPDTEFSSIIAQTLKNLSENAENIQNQLTDEDLMNLLGTFSNITDSNQDGSDLLPMMQKMIQNLLTKDVLHPALSSIVEQYPEWLEKNKSVLSSNDFDNYTQQYKLMKEVCEELEKEKPDDSQEVKNTRFDQILGLMQKIQDCGQPPAELSGNLGPMLSLDEHGNPQIPPNFSPSQCNLM